MNLVDYLRTLLRRWPLIAALAVAGLAAGLLLAQRETPMYRSTSSVLLVPEPRQSSSELVQGSNYVSNLVDSYVNVATSDLVLGPVTEELGLDISPQGLARSVSAESPLNTLVIEIEVVNADPAEAQRIAAAVTDQLSTAAEVVSPSSGGQAAVRLTTITEARRPSAPFSPNTRLYAAAGLLVGAGLGVAYALLRRLLGTAVNDSSEIAGVTDLPVLGEIVEAKSPRTLPQAMLADPLGREAESLRALAANLRFLAVDKRLRSIIVTSGAPGEAKSSVSTGTALALAESSERVLLIDGDLRAPSQHQLTHLNNAVGLSDVLVGSVTLTDAVQGWGDNGLDVLTSGRLPPNPAQLMGSDAMHTLLQEAADSYDRVIIDTPPVLLVTDALWLSMQVDGVLVVARRGRTTTRALHRTLSALDNAPVLGVTLSRVPRAQKSDYAPRRERRVLTRRQRGR